MTRNKPISAIATLVRWREFRQKRAAIAFQSRSHEASLARSCSEEARAKVDDIRAQLSSMLSERSIDISQLQWVSQIEDITWQQLQSAQAELSQTVEAQSLAQAAHLAARAQTEVAAKRSQHERAIGSDRDEKAAFDRMAELYRPAVRRP